MAFPTSLLFALQLVVQAGAGNADARRAPAREPAALDSVRRDPAPLLRSAKATRTRDPIIIDGRADDPAWTSANVITGFRVYSPTEDGEPTFRTEARVLFDDRNVYVHVRAFDPHPDSIVGLLSRRDVQTASDYLTVAIDSYHDRRTAFLFSVNPAGVQRDRYMYNDGAEDPSWDGVWDAKAVIDSLGWTAEFRIPLGQLRFASRQDQLFGIMITRDVARTREQYSWPLLRRSQTGVVSQFGDVTGLGALPSPRRLEIRPYLVERNVSQVRGLEVSRSQEQSAGVDVKYGLGGSLTLDATINPDFGQVEADPAVLNLSAFEQAFQERRPFFLEGASIFSFDLDCNDGACTGLFYPRRIGRSPQLRDSYGDASTPRNTTILGAAKLTGRLASGLSLGFLDAVTDREVGTERRTVEPSANYLVARAVQEFDKGNTVVGGMLTGINRALDQWTKGSLRNESYVVGIDGKHRFGQGRFELKGFLAASRVSGSDSAITITQRSSVQQFQRPDGGLSLDSTRTSLSGWAGQISLNKNGGGHTRFSTSYRRVGPGFEINDVGYLRRADTQSWSNWFQIATQKPAAFYRRLSVNLNQSNQWTAEGLRIGSGGNINMNSELKNFWSVYGGIGADNLLPTFDDRATRGGPAVRQSPSLFGWSGVSLDPRRALVPGLNLFWNRSDVGRSYSVDVNPQVSFRGSSRVQGSIGLDFNRSTNDTQFDGNFGVVGNDSTHYTIARLDQNTASITARLDVTATPTLSLQLYAQPFVTSGRYLDWRQLRAPRAAQFSDRYAPYDGGDPGAFNYKQLRTNLVVRWEYRPGSTIFAVWQQGRTQDGINPGSFQAGRDFRGLFRAWPDNTFLIKASYWLGR